MELKFIKNHVIFAFSVAFNRTNMELKFINFRCSKNDRRTFNRTNMELKYEFLLVSGTSIILLIEPIWN